jgi:hypothetical protein
VKRTCEYAKERITNEIKNPKDWRPVSICTGRIYERRVTKTTEIVEVFITIQQFRESEILIENACDANPVANPIPNATKPSKQYCPKILKKLSKFLEFGELLVRLATTLVKVGEKKYGESGLLISE